MSPADSTLAIDKRTLKVRLAAQRGRVIVDVRYFYQPSTGGALKPTLRGVTLPASYLHEIILALEQLKAQMISDGALELTGEENHPKFHPQVYPSDF